jgi:hypothetical protein
MELWLMRHLLWILLVRTLAVPAHAGDQEMKEIKYRGGRVGFFIPKHWVKRTVKGSPIAARSAPR